MNPTSHSNAQRIVRDYVQSIPASGDVIFPLLCPERERAWLDGWDYSMIHSQSGYAEEGCVFSTCDGDNVTVWVITRHDPQAREIQFARFTAGLAATTLAVRVEQVAADRSRVHIRYVHTSLGAAGDAFLATVTEDSFNERMQFWEASMTHYLQTGTRLSPARFAQARGKVGGWLHHLRHRR